MFIPKYYCHVCKLDQQQWTAAKKNIKIESMQTHDFSFIFTKFQVHADDDDTTSESYELCTYFLHLMTFCEKISQLKTKTKNKREASEGRQTSSLRQCFNFSVLSTENRKFHIKLSQLHLNVRGKSTKKSHRVANSHFSIIFLLLSFFFHFGAIIKQFFFHK